MVFIIGIMMFLMAIGVSTMAAAAANSMFIMKQGSFNRVGLLADSIHESILFSLQAEPPAGPLDVADYKSTLAYQLAWAIYKANDADYNGIPNPVNPGKFIGLANITDFNIRIDGININSIDNHMNTIITFEFPNQLVNIKPFKPMEEGESTVDGEEIFPKRDREPKTATINASMIVRVVVTAGVEERSITSIAYYEFTGGILTDDPYNSYGNDQSLVLKPMEFAPGEYGEWRLVRREIIDT